MSAGTKPRAIRLDNDLWRACQAKAERTGITVTSVIRERLAAWVDEDEAESGHPGSPHIAYVLGSGYVEVETAADCQVCRR